MKPDTNYLSYADQSNLVLDGMTIQPDVPSDWDDVLKISCCKFTEVNHCIINPDGGNREDGVDVMRESYCVSFNNCHVGAGQRYAFTIKGGCDLIRLKDVTIIRHGGGWERVDIDIGNWSTTTPKKTDAVFLTNVTASDGKPVRVRVGWARRPEILGGNVKILFWQSLGLKLYCLVMRFLNLFKK